MGWETGNGTAPQEWNQKFQGEVWVENEPAKLRNNVMVLWQPKQTWIQLSHCPAGKAFLGFQPLAAGLGGWNPNF